MKIEKYLLIIGGFFAVVLVWISFTQITRPSIPDLHLLDINGETRALADFRGRPLVINLWATWCGPCREEMPVLAEAQAHEQDIHFVFINQGESSAIVSRYLRTEGLTLNHVLLDAPSRSLRLLGAQGMPATFFFDAQSNLVDVHTGVLTSDTLTQKLLLISTTNE